jgi:hypothetical protein
VSGTKNLLRIDTSPPGFKGLGYEVALLVALFYYVGGTKKTVLRIDTSPPRV